MASTSSDTPMPDQSEENINDRRLWIGNLDLRITEFVLLKLVQRFGKPERFDFMYHISGPEKGRPKGYCFVTYPKKEMAERAVRALNSKMALSRRLIVHWAREKFTPDPLASCSSGLTSKAEERPAPTSESTKSTIRAIEAKLSAMEQTQKDFGLTELPAAPPGTNRYSCVNKAASNANDSRNNNNGKGPYSRRKPFVNNDRRGRRR